jgi:hypothetical protein
MREMMKTKTEIKGENSNHNQGTQSQTKKERKIYKNKQKDYFEKILKK